MTKKTTILVYLFAFSCFSSHAATVFAMENVSPSAEVNSNEHVVVVPETADLSLTLLGEGKIFRIQYGYDLRGKTIRVGTGSILDFQGGKINNGVIVGERIRVTGIVDLGGSEFGNNCIEDKIYQIDWFDDAQRAFGQLLNLESGKTIEFSDHEYSFSNSKEYIVSAPVVIKGNGSTTLKMNPEISILQNANMTIRDIIFKWGSPNNKPFIISSAYNTLVEGLGWHNGGTFCTMGTADKKAYNLHISNSRGLQLANIGKPFVELRNGAGFYWETFDEIHYIESDGTTQTPKYSRSSVMNVKDGTDVIDITGSWDTGHVKFFAEKVYDAIRVRSKSKEQITVQNFQIFDCIFDFCRGCGLRIDSEMTSFVGNSISNCYIGTWEDSAIKVIGSKALYFNSNILDKLFVPFSGTYGIEINVKNAYPSKNVITNNIFERISRKNDTDHYPTIFLYGCSSTTIIGNKNLYSSEVSSFPWSVIGELSIVSNGGGSNVITGNIFNSIKIDDLGYGRDSQSLKRTNKNLICNNVINVINDKCYTYEKIFDAPTWWFTIPKSGAPKLNPYGCNIQLLLNSLDGISSISINDVSIPLINVIDLGPKDSFAITYSKTPSFKVRVMN